MADPIDLEALAIWIESFNAWRRGQGTQDMPHPVEIGKRLDEAARAVRLAAQMAEVLAPIAEKFLSPDDHGEAMAAGIRAEPDWSEEKNDRDAEDVWIKRGTIRRARELWKEVGHG